MRQLAYCFGALVIDGDGDAGAVDGDEPSDEALLPIELLLLTDGTAAGLLSMRLQWPSRKAPGSIARL